MLIPCVNRRPNSLNELLSLILTHHITVVEEVIKDRPSNPRDLSVNVIYLILLVQDVGNLTRTNSSARCHGEANNEVWEVSRDTQRIVPNPNWPCPVIPMEQEHSPSCLVPKKPTLRI